MRVLLIGLTTLGCAPSPCLLADGSDEITVTVTEDDLVDVPITVSVPSRLPLDDSWLDGRVILDSGPELVNVAITDCSSSVATSFEMGGELATHQDLLLWRGASIGGCGEGVPCVIGACVTLRSAPGSGDTTVTVGGSASLWEPGGRADCADTEGLGVTVGQVPDEAVDAAE
jgi:hypothetical protein